MALPVIAGVLIAAIASIAVVITREYIYKAMSTAVSVSLIWGFKALVKVAPGRSMDIMKVIIESYTGASGTWGAFVSEYMKQITTRSLPIEDLVGKPIGAYTDQATKMFIDTFFNDMLSAIMPTPAEIASDPMAGAEKYLSANLKFQMDAWWMHVLGDMMSFGIFKSLKDLPNAISWSFGLGWLSWLVLGTPFRLGIVGPMERHFNRVYLPTKLTAAQNIEALRRGLITPEDFDHSMIDMGYSAEDSIRLFEMAKRDISRGDLKLMLMRGMMDKEQIEEELAGQGFSEAYGKAFVRMMEEDRAWDLLDDVSKQVQKLYSKGFVTEETLRAYLIPLGWTEDEIKPLLAKLNLERFEEYTFSDTDIANMYEKGLKTWNWCARELVARGRSDMDAEVYMLLHVAEKLWPKEVRRPPVD